MAPGSRSMTACRPQADMRKAPRGRRAVKVAAAALSWFFTPSTLGLPVRATAQPAVKLHAGFSMATLGGPDSTDVDHRFHDVDHGFHDMSITVWERRSIAALGLGVEG